MTYHDTSHCPEQFVFSQVTSIRRPLLLHPAPLLLPVPRPPPPLLFLFLISSRAAGAVGPEKKQQRSSGAEEEKQVDLPPRAPAFTSPLPRSSSPLLGSFPAPISLPVAAHTRRICSFSTPPLRRGLHGHSAALVARLALFWPLFSSNCFSI
jgi:hypothetical protein